jgi:hypothetical protein
MPGLVPGVHAFLLAAMRNVDGRDKPGHDDYEIFRKIKYAGVRPSRIALAS